MDKQEKIAQNKERVAYLKEMIKLLKQEIAIILSENKVMEGDPHTIGFQYGSHKKDKFDGNSY